MWICCVCIVKKKVNQDCSYFWTRLYFILFLLFSFFSSETATVTRARKIVVDDVVRGVGVELGRIVFPIISWRDSRRLFLCANIVVLKRLCAGICHAFSCVCVCVCVLCFPQGEQLSRSESIPNEFIIARARFGK